MRKQIILKPKNWEENLPIYMSSKDWIMAYKTGLPHWAEESEPSRLAKVFLKYIGKGKKTILEIGIGNGRDSLYFAEHKNIVFGIDIVPEAIKLAKLKARKLNIKNIKFSVGNAEKLMFRDNFFDAMYSLSVLHCTKLEKSLKEISRVLKPGGKLIIYLYEVTVVKNRKFWFYKEKEIIEIANKNNLNIIDHWDNWEMGHKDEKTRILIFKMQKKSL